MKACQESTISVENPCTFHNSKEIAMLKDGTDDSTLRDIGRALGMRGLRDREVYSWGLDVPLC